MKRKKSRGGARPGAGRPRKAPTQVIRVPQTMVEPIQHWLDQAKTHPAGTAALLFPAADPVPLTLTLYQSRISAGFPSPADDYIEGQLDLNQYLIDRPAATFFVRVSGDSMLGAGIHPDDLLIVDRSVQAREGSIVIAVLDGELLVKRLRCQPTLQLCSEHPAYAPITITEAQDFSVWGVVRHVIHSV